MNQISESLVGGGLFATVLGTAAIESDCPHGIIIALIGIVCLSAGVIISNRVAETRHRAEQAAIKRSRLIRSHRLAFRRGLRNAAAIESWRRG